MQVVYCEAVAMVEEYQQEVSVANLRGIPDLQTLFSQLGLENLQVIQIWIYGFEILPEDPMSRGKLAQTFNKIVLVRINRYQSCHLNMDFM